MKEEIGIGEGGDRELKAFNGMSKARPGSRRSSTGFLQVPLSNCACHFGGGLRHSRQEGEGRRKEGEGNETDREVEKIADEILEDFFFEE